MTSAENKITAHLCGEQRGDVVEAVAVVVGDDQLQYGELSSLREGQVDADTEAGQRGRDPQTVTRARLTLQSSARRHVVQHVGLQQTCLLLRGEGSNRYYDVVLCTETCIYWKY